MIRRPPRSTLSSSSAASDVYKRQAYILCEVDTKNYDEIANITGVPVGTVRSRIFRARQYLMENLKERL